MTMTKWAASLVFIAAASSIPLAAKELQKKEKEEYSADKSFTDIIYSPEDASTHPISKHKFHIVYQKLTTEVPSIYRKLILGDMVAVITGKNTRKVPLLFKKKDKALEGKFQAIPVDTTVTIYGTLRHKTYKKNNYYYIWVDDVEKFAVTDAFTPSGTEEFNALDYRPTSPREFKVKFIELLDTKISMTLHVRNIINYISPAYQKLAGFTLEDYFLIQAVQIRQLINVQPKETETSPLGIDVLASRKNKNVTEKLINTSHAEDMVFYGTLKKLQDPTKPNSRPLYFFYLDALK